MESAREKVAILGAGGTGLLMAETIDWTAEHEFIGFLDDHKQAVEGYSRYRVLGRLADWKLLPVDVLFLASLYGAKKNEAFHELVGSLGIPEWRWATVMHVSAVVSPTADIAIGAYIGPLTVVEPSVQLGPRCALLGGVYVAHHSRLGEFVCCANNASVAGGVEIGTAAFIGANASVREYVTIGAYSIVGMGSVVVADVAPRQIVAGNPARPLKHAAGSADGDTG